MPGFLPILSDPAIKVRGNSRTTFLFPATINTSLGYFSNYRRVFSNLPHVRVLKSADEGYFRLGYKTLELGLYQVEIVCDVQVNLENSETWGRMIFNPVDSQIPAKPSAGFHHLAGEGRYSSESIFEPYGDITAIHFSLQIEADLPCPWGLLVLPSSTRDRIADSIMVHRIHEITQGFIQRSISDFQAGTHQDTGK